MRGAAAFLAGIQLSPYVAWWTTTPVVGRREGNSAQLTQPAIAPPRRRMPNASVPAIAVASLVSAVRSFSERRIHVPASPSSRDPHSGCADSVSTGLGLDRKSTRLNSSHSQISYAVFCLKKKKKKTRLLDWLHR